MLFTNLPPLVSITVTKNSQAVALLVEAVQAANSPSSMRLWASNIILSWHSVVLYATSLEIKWSQASLSLRGAEGVGTLQWQELRSPTAQQFPALISLREEVREEQSLGEKKSGVKAWCGKASSESSEQREQRTGCSFRGCCGRGRKDKGWGYGCSREGIPSVKEKRWVSWSVFDCISQSSW